MEQQQKAARYAAFISYRHRPRDRTWADWLIRSLESFHVPKQLQAEGFPSRIGRLFRDEDELSASPDLSEELQKALLRSDALIVVCSPDSPSSRHVRQEIEYFQLLGRGDRIFPVLIAGEPMESFPQELRRELVVRAESTQGGLTRWKEVEPLAIDLRERQDASLKVVKQRALLKLVAPLIGCNYDDLAQRNAQRIRWQRLKILAVSVTSVATIFIGGAIYWDNNLRVKVQDCANIAFRWGLPECVYELRVSERKGRTLSFRIERKANQVLSLSKIGGDGQLTVRHQTRNEFYPWYEGAARVKFAPQTSDKRQALAAEAFDISGTLLYKTTVTFNRSGQQAFIRTTPLIDDAFTEQIDLTAETETGTFTRPGEDKEEEVRSAIAMHAVEFDQEGRDKQRAYRTNAGTAVHDGVGSYGVKFEYTPLGLISTKINLSQTLHPQSNRFGVVALRYAYGQFGNLTELITVGADNKPIAGDRNVATIQYKYDDRQNIIETIYLGADGNGVLSKDVGYSRGLWRYDAEGDLVVAKYFDAADKPTNDSKLGAAELRWSHDEVGRGISVRYFDRRGEPVYRRGFGVHRIATAFDEKGNIISEKYFDVSDNPILGGKVGVAELHRTYNDKGQLIGVAYKGVDGKPIRERDTRAAYRDFAFEAGKRRSETFRDPDGNPTIHYRLGVAKLEWEYDPATGNISKEAYFGLEGEPAVSRDSGAAALLFTYGPEGYQTLSRYEDSAGQTVPDKDIGVYQTRRVYDPFGNRVEIRYENAEGALMTRKDWGTSVLRSTFDNRGRRTAIAHLNDSRKEVLKFGDGFHRTTFDFNELDWTKESFFDESGNLTQFKSEGYSRIDRKLDALGREILRLFHDDLNQLSNDNSWGVFGVRTFYDERGNIISEEYIDSEGNLMERSDIGIAVKEWTFDEFDREIERRFYGADRKPAKVGDWQTAGARFEYNAEGKQTRQTFIDETGTPTISASWGGYSTIEWMYDEFGNNIEARYLDLKGRIMNHKDSGVAAYRKVYSPRGDLISESKFDANLRPTAGHAQEEFDGWSQAKYVHRTEWEYDLRGNITAIRQFNTFGKPANGKPKRMPEIADYDLVEENDQKINEEQFDAFLNAGEIFSQAVFTYDNADQLLTVEFLFADESGKLLSFEEMTKKHSNLK